MGIDYSLIGQRIKKRRRAAGKTQDDLAESLGFSIGYISQIERGISKVNLETLSRIADSLGCDLCELIDSSSSRTQSYLSAELDEIYRTLSDSQRRLLLEIAVLISKY